MKRIYVFDNVKIRIWQWKNTGTMNRPLRLAECTWCISWANVDISQNVCNLFFICMLHNRHTKVWFLPCKNHTFAAQKLYFYIAKNPFLKLENIHHPKPHRLFIAQTYGIEHSARHFYQFIAPVPSTKTTNFGYAKYYELRC